MKNLAIAILTGIIISDWSFWLYEDWLDKALVIICAAMIIMCALSFIDDQVVAYRRRRQRVEMFKRNLRQIQVEIKNEDSAAGKHSRALK